jgi:hypothetical protein
MKGPIKWSRVRDRHQEGRWSRGRVWIREDREGQVTGMYWQDGSVMQKRNPESEEERTLKGARILLQILVETLEMKGSKI